jgi:hypothetical protein
VTFSVVLSVSGAVVSTLIYVDEALKPLKMVEKSKFEVDL